MFILPLLVNKKTFCEQAQVVFLTFASLSSRNQDILSRYIHTHTHLDRNNPCPSGSIVSNPANYLLIALSINSCSHLAHKMHIPRQCRIWKSIYSFIVPSRMRLLSGTEHHATEFLSPVAVHGLSWLRFYPTTKLRNAEEDSANLSYSMYIPQPHPRTSTHQPQTSLLFFFFQYSVPRHIKAVTTWQRRKQTHQQTLLDRTVFCSC